MGTHLTPLGRFVLLLTLLAVGAVVGAAGASARRPHAQSWRCVVIHPGDTLWALAQKVSRADPRATVDRIVTRNALDTAAISPGMALWVPADGPGYAASQSECGVTP
jgi:hypothetical protein